MLSDRRAQFPMTADRWDRLWRLFHRALELAPEEREALLVRLRGEDPELVSELAGLLAGHEQQHSLMDQPPLAVPELQADQRLGVWRLIRELGAGGMGVVWLAERADGSYHQQTAIKVLAAPFGAPGLVKRFWRERQILARLKHPYIAALLDGGTTPDGRPYLVMEYVDGVVLDQYCRDRAVNLEARLDLFQRVCEAVDYAHRHLVVHRDLKPGNVLVTSEGTPKLLDFGIAKLLEDDLESPLTLPAERRLTPDYASPELLRGEATTTATDCYALGVMLYELLAGSRPWRLHGLTAERALAVIDRHDAPALSRAAAANRLPPDQVRALRGDLNNIVHKAIRREPEERYASARDLGADIKRYLRGLPVSARADNWRYRTVTFVRRHRLAVGAAGVALVLLLALTAALGWQTWQLNQALIQAQRQTQRAGALNTFLVDLFLGADPDRHAGDPLTVESLLAQGADRLLTAFERQPELKSELLVTLGRIHAHLGDYEEADRLLTEALVLSETYLGSDHLITARAAAELAVTYVHSGRHAEAEAAARRALAIFERGHGASQAGKRHAHLILATALQSRGRLDEAEVELRKALDGPALATPLAIEGWIRLGAIAWGRGNFIQAETEYRRALTAAQGLYGERSSQTARAMNAVAAALYRQGRYGAAKTMYLDTLALRKAIYGEDHPTVAETLSHLGALAYDQGDYQGAVAHQEKALELLVRIHGKDNVLLSPTHNNLALALMALDRYRDAEQHYLEALRLNRAALGDLHPAVGSGLSNLGLLYLEQQRYEEAKAALSEALSIQQTHYQAPHFATSYTLNHLGRLYLGLGQLPAARDYFEQALSMRLTVLEAGHPALADTRLWFGRLELASEHPGAAANQFEQAYAIRQKTLGKEDWRSIEAGGFLGAALLRNGERERGRGLYDDNLKRLTNLRGTDDARVQALRAAADGL